VLTQSADAVVTIMDMAGRIVLRENHKLSAGTQRLALNIENLPTGSYMLEVSDGTHTSQQKFVKK
jgi:hypothetical protein